MRGPKSLGQVKIKMERDGHDTATARATLDNFGELQKGVASVGISLSKDQLRVTT
jgi:hypothetical protein